jgi:Tat protein secretion system quality control protein TatD with DNase activity
MARTWLHILSERALSAIQVSQPSNSPSSFFRNQKIMKTGHIPMIAEKIAELKGVSVNEVLKVTRENTRKMFGI